MKKIIFPFLFLVFYLVPFQGTAQTRVQNFHLTLTYPSVKQQNRLASLFYMLADNNNQDLYNIYLKLSFNLHFSIIASANKSWIINYRISDKKISGDVRFRGFDVASLLIPQKAGIELLLYQGHQLVNTIQDTISLYHGKILLPFIEKKPDPPVLVTIKINHVIFTRENYLHFVQMAGLINHYYGYREIIKQLDKFIVPAGEHPPASSVFLDYALLTRLVNYIRWHNFPAKLDLARSDTLNFEKVFGDILRKKTRMKTLTQQIFDENIRASTIDKEKFIKGFVTFSTRAISLAKGYQPYKATSFDEFAQIFPNKAAADFIRKVQNYYGQYDKDGQSTVPVGIYKSFIDAASLKIKQQSFVRALELLSNAAYFEKNFPGVKHIALFDTCLVHARDGLSLAYLKVALMAADRKDNLLATRYIKKASLSLHAMDNKIGPPARAVCYPKSAHEMMKMAGIFSEQGYFHYAFSLLKFAREACAQLPGSDTMNRKICGNLSEKAFLNSQKLLKKGNVKAARDTLLNLVKDYNALCPSTSNVSADKVFKEAALPVFQQALLRGEYWQHKNQNDRVIFYLNMAIQLQKTFSLPDDADLNVLLDKTTVPRILSLIGEANLEIWRKHFHKADSIYLLATKLSHRYDVSGNKMVEKALKNLAVKKKQADCQWQQENIDHFFTLAGHAVKEYKIISAKNYIQKARHVYLKLKDNSCLSAKHRTDSIFRTYENIFRFTEEYHELTQKLFNEGLATVMPEFIRLQQQYQSEDLHKFGLPFTGLYQFIQSQHSEILIMKAVHYFIQKKDFASALLYLQLSKDPAKSKAEQKQIALGFARSGLTPGSFILGNASFGYFTKAYLRAKKGIYH